MDKEFFLRKILVTGLCWKSPPPALLGWVPHRLPQGPEVSGQEITGRVEDVLKTPSGSKGIWGTL